MRESDVDRLEGHRSRACCSPPPGLPGGQHGGAKEEAAADRSDGDGDTIYGVDADDEKGDNRITTEDIGDRSGAAGVGVAASNTGRVVKGSTIAAALLSALVASAAGLDTGLATLFIRSSRVDATSDLGDEEQVLLESEIRENQLFDLEEPQKQTRTPRPKAKFTPAAMVPRGPRGSASSSASLLQPPSTRATTVPPLAPHTTITVLPPTGGVSSTPIPGPKAVGAPHNSGQPSAPQGGELSPPTSPSQQRWEETVQAIPAEALANAMGRLAEVASNIT